ncbi:MAG: family 16 glycosylhydrolase, partial [Anaerolineae bacterium]
TGGTLFVDVLDNRNPGSTSDDAERWSVDIPDDFSGWQLFRFVWADFHRKDIGNGAPNDGFTLSEIYGYGIGGYGNVDMGSRTYYADEVTIFGDTGVVEQPLELEFAASSYEVREGETATVTVTLSVSATLPVSITYRTAEGYAMPGRDYTPASGVVVIAPGQLTQSFEVVTLPDSKAEGDEALMLNLYNPVNAAAGFQVRATLTILDDDQPDPTLLDDFEGYYLFNEINNAALSISEITAGTAMALPGQGAYEQILTATAGSTGGSGNPAFTRLFPVAQDWSAYNGLKFWYYGNNSGEQIAVQVLDNQSATTAQTSPADWELIWSDEFNAATGAAPNANVWRNEIGDGTLNGIAGWGNSELEYYTAGADNAAADGNGNLAITLDQIAPDSGLLCWYGPCEYSSARLISANRIETQYGRIEARIRVPDGAAGLWPAFWMLGTNIDEVGWPQSGEIDIMEYVSRNPNEVFGTIHGPGYSGGAAIGRTYTLPQPVADDYHTFSVEWSPDELHWYVDGINYHTVTAADVAPREWVFNHPFYLLLNLAVGGNFGGTISPDLTFPQQMLVDYVRVYQATNTSERFVASFTDNFSGWREVSLPFSVFTRDTLQPVGAPNDGFGLDDVWGYGFSLPEAGNSTLNLDQVRLARTPLIPRSRRFNIDQDTFLNGAQPSMAYGNAQTMWAGFFGLMRPLVHVPVSGIPVDAEVDAAYLYLYVVEGRGFTQWSNSVINEVAAQAITTPWLADSATWSMPWTMAGGDYGPALSATHLGSGKLNTWLRLDVTAAMQDIVRGEDNNGFLITANDDHGVRYALASQNYWDPSKIGYVRVYYRTVE